MKKKICFLVTEHPFLDARIFKKEAKSLLKQGYDVSMIVPRINGYLFDINGTKLTNRFGSQTFLHEGIKIITYERIYPEKKIKSLYYNIQSREHRRFVDELTQLGLLQEADIYHAHEFFSLYSGIGIKRALKSTKGKEVKLIYDSHELTPDPLEANTKRLKQYMFPMLQLMLKEVDHIITVSQSIKSWYLSIDPNLPVEVIYNSPPLVTNYEDKDFNKDGIVAVHEGFINNTRGNWKKLLNITDICNKKINFRFKIIGGAKGPDSNKLTIPRSLIDKIEFLDWMDYYLIPKAMKDVDIGWIDLNLTNSLNNRFAMPNKFFSYLSNGVPVIVNKCTDMENFIKTHECGLVIEKLNASGEDYSQAINYLYNNRAILQQMSVNARKVMEESYSWEHMEKRLFTVYDYLINKNF